MVSNAASSVCTASGLPENPHGDLRGDPERPLRADQQAEQIRSRCVGDSSPPICTSSPIGQHDLRREHVVHGEPVLQAVRAAGVLGDVAADRAHLLTRGIGRVVVAERRDLPGDLEVGDAGLDRDPAVRRCRRSSTRLRRDSAITMPPSTGSAPPDRPVPWPRGTNGTPSRRAQPDDLLHLGRRRLAAPPRPATGAGASARRTRRSAPPAAC